MFCGNFSIQIYFTYIFKFISERHVARRIYFRAEPSRLHHQEGRPIRRRPLHLHRQQRSRSSGNGSNCSSSFMWVQMSSLLNSSGVSLFNFQLISKVLRKLELYLNLFWVVHLCFTIEITNPSSNTGQAKSHSSLLFLLCFILANKLDTHLTFSSNLWLLIIVIELVQFTKCFQYVLQFDLTFSPRLSWTCFELIQIERQ